MEELYFDTRIIIVNKPAGVLSQPDGSSTPCVTDSYHKVPNQKFPVAAHRLDRNTSGCQILVRNPKAARRMHDLILKGQVTKEYLAVVRGNTPDKGRIDVALRKFENKSYADKRGKNALTEFRTLARGTEASLVLVQIATGRFHQIRAHFAHIRNPLFGDRKYGQGSSARKFSRPALHAWRAEILNLSPSKPKIEVTAPLPQDFLELLEKHALPWKD